MRDEDLAVRLADRLRPDLRDLEVDQVRGDQHARLDRRADRDDGDREVLRADLPQRVDDRASACTAWVTRSDHFCTRSASSSTASTSRSSRSSWPARRGAEAAEPDHEDGCVVRDPVNQRWASLLVAGTAARRWLAARAAARVTVPMRPRNMVAARTYLRGVGRALR